MCKSNHEEAGATDPTGFAPITLHPNAGFRNPNPRPPRGPRARTERKAVPVQHQPLPKSNLYPTHYFHGSVETSKPLVLACITRNPAGQR